MQRGLLQIVLVDLTPPETIGLVLVTGIAVAGKAFRAKAVSAAAPVSTLALEKCEPKKNLTVLRGPLEGFCIWDTFRWLQCLRRPQAAESRLGLSMSLSFQTYPSVVPVTLNLVTQPYCLCHPFHCRQGVESRLINHSTLSRVSAVMVPIGELVETHSRTIVE